MLTKKRASFLFCIKGSQNTFHPQSILHTAKENNSRFRIREVYLPEILIRKRLVAMITVVK